MFNFASIGLFCLLFFSPAVSNTPGGKLEMERVNPLISSLEACLDIYCDAGLEGKLDFETFQRAVGGLTTFSTPKQDILTIIDFTKPSSEKRFFVIDLVNRRLLYHTLVAHGRNSGERECTRFSNRPSSLQSSPGFYHTAESYTGRQGFSLRLDGLEPGVNDQARARGIVIHGADYVCEEYIEEYGYIGRSWGCPALPLNVNKKVIDLIKDGTCLYIHTDHPTYAAGTALKTLPEQTVQFF